MSDERVRAALPPARVKLAGGRGRAAIRRWVLLRHCEAPEVIGTDLDEAARLRHCAITDRL